MNREEKLAVRQQWTGVLQAVETAERGILDQLDVLGELAVSAQRSQDPFGFDLECAVERIRAQLASLDVQLAALVRDETSEPVHAEEAAPVLVG